MKRQLNCELQLEDKMIGRPPYVHFVAIREMYIPNEVESGDRIKIIRTLRSISQSQIFRNSNVGSL